MLIFLNKVRQDRLGETSSPTFGGWGTSAGPGKICIISLEISFFVCLLVPGYMPVDSQTT